MNFKNKAFAGILAIAFAASVSSCHIYKKFEMPDEVSPEVKEALQSAPDSTAYGNLTWQQVFTDPLLQDYITRALANNVNLENAKLNVDIARANLLGAKLSYLPSVAFTPNGAGASYAHSDMSWTYTLPVAISWEIDVFAKLLNNKWAAQTAVDLQGYYLQAVQSQIIGGVASCYYTIATLNSQLELSRQTAEIWAKSVDIMKDYKEAGRVTQAAVVQSEAQYWSILGQITDLESSLVQANNAMSVLLNESPATWEVTASARLEVPQILRDGVPMRELAQRPDVRVAEQSLAAAYYTTNSARAAFYPGITISSNGGFTNLLGSFIKNPGDWFIQLAGQLTAPLFSRGQNIARLKGAKIQQQQALNSFEHTLVQAASEVNNYLVAVDKAGEKSKYLSKQVANLEEAVEDTNLLLAYDGKTTYLEVLNAQSSLLSAQMSLLSNELSREQALINLYQSLGGGR